MSYPLGSIPFSGLIGTSLNTDTYSVTSDELNLGGYRSVVSNTARDSIPVPRRRFGMMVGVLNGTGAGATTAYYTLMDVAGTNDLSLNGTNWVLLNAGGVSSVSNSDGTLTITPTTGAVVVSLALGHANSWTALQTFITSKFYSATSGNTAITFQALNSTDNFTYGMNGNGMNSFFVVNQLKATSSMQGTTSGSGALLSLQDSYSISGLYNLELQAYGQTTGTGDAQSLRFTHNVSGAASQVGFNWVQSYWYKNSSFLSTKMGDFGVMLLNNTSGTEQTAFRWQLMNAGTYSESMRLNGRYLGIGVTAATAYIHPAASTTAAASIRIPSGVNPTTPNDGDFWYNGTNLYFNHAGTSVDLLNSGTGTVTTVSVVNTNGFSGTVATATTTPAITLTTTFTGIAYSSGGTLSAAVAANFPTLNQNTTGTAANITATSNSTLTTLSALSLPYSQLSGTVPTWNQNTTGTAANITATTNSTLTTLSALSLPYSQITGAPSYNATNLYIGTFTTGSSWSIPSAGNTIQSALQQIQTNITYMPNNVYISTFTPNGAWLIPSGGTTIQSVLQELQGNINFAAANVTLKTWTAGAGTITSSDTLLTALQKLQGNITASGGVTTVSNSDGTLTVTPTSGAVVASLALGHANTWTATQTFSGVSLSSFTTGSVPFIGASGALTQNNSALFWDNTNSRFLINTNLTVANFFAQGTTSSTYAAYIKGVSTQTAALQVETANTTSLQAALSLYSSGANQNAINFSSYNTAAAFQYGFYGTGLVGFMNVHQLTGTSIMQGTASGAALWSVQDSNTSLGQLYMMELQAYGQTTTTGADAYALRFTHVGAGVTSPVGFNWMQAYYYKTASSTGPRYADFGIMLLNNSAGTENTAWRWRNMVSGTVIETMRINGQYLGIGVTAATAYVHAAASTTSAASYRIPSGSNPTSPNSGDFWYNGTNLYFRNGTTSVDLLALGSGAVTSVTNTDGTITISGTATAPVVSIALGHSNTWTAKQTFNNTIGVNSIYNILSTPDLAIDVNNYKLQKGGNTVFNWGNSQLNDYTGALSIDLAARLMYNYYGVATVDYFNQYLLNGTYTVIDWNTGVLNLPSGTYAGYNVIDFVNYQIKNPIHSLTAIDWSAYNLGAYNSSTTTNINTLNWLTCDLFSVTDGVPALNWKTRKLTNHFNNLVFDWDAGKLYNSVGNNILDASSSYGLGLGGVAGTNTAFVSLAACTSISASLNLASGTAPSIHNSGNLSWDGTHLYFDTATGTVDLLTTGSASLNYPNATLALDLTTNYQAQLNSQHGSFKLDGSGGNIFSDTGAVYGPAIVLRLTSETDVGGGTTGNNWIVVGSSTGNTGLVQNTGNNSMMIGTAGGYGGGTSTANSFITNSGDNSFILGQVSDQGQITNSSHTSFIASYTTSGGQVNNGGNNCFVMGYAKNSGIIQTGAFSAMVWGIVDGSGSYLQNTGPASVTFGQAIAAGNINSKDYATLVFGTADNGTIIAHAYDVSGHPDGSGALVHGYATAGATIETKAQGAHSHGFANGGFSITASGLGAHSSGATYLGSITAAGKASFVHGDNVSTSADYATVFGTGVSSSEAQSFTIGYGGINFKVGTNRVLFKDAHLQTSQTTAPTILTYPTLGGGTGCTASVQGTDTAGTITFMSGTGGFHADLMCGITFNRAFTSSTPTVILVPGNTAAARLMYDKEVVASVTSTAMYIYCGIALSTTSTYYEFTYLILDQV